MTDKSRTPAWDAVRRERDEAETVQVGHGATAGESERQFARVTITDVSDPRPPRYRVLDHPSAEDDIGIGLGASIGRTPAVYDLDAKRIADKMNAIAKKHGGKTPDAVAELVEMLRAEGWHLELTSEEDGVRQWSAERD